MVCKYCGFQNNSESRFCGGCGRKLVQKKRPNRFFWGLFAVSLVIVGIIIGMLIPAENVVCKLPMNTAEITQVIPMDNGAVAVLYTDGTARVSGDSHIAGIVSAWTHVRELIYDPMNPLCGYEPLLLALTEDGSVLSTELDLSGWKNIKKIIFHYEGIVGITTDGKVMALGNWEDDSFLTSLSNVEDLIYADIQDIWGCLMKDGSVGIFDSHGYQYENHWNSVKELRDSGHGFYAIMLDGTVDGQIEDTYAGLTGAVKLVDYYDWVFGISADGRLLTHNNGNIYMDAGQLWVDTPGNPYHMGEVDTRQFNQVRDVVAFRGLILLNEDGTVVDMCEGLDWDLSAWEDIRSVYGADEWSGWEMPTLYGIRRDGSVIVAQREVYADEQTVMNHYRGWKLQALYLGNGGAIGVTTEGKLVGDGAYEYTDFSVF